MGEYYKWVNIDKKEYIDPSDFVLGCKKWQSAARGNEVLLALQDLLSKEWEGDHVLFLGDEKEIEEGSQNKTVQVLYEHAVEAGNTGYAADTVFESYRNISGCLIKVRYLSQMLLNKSISKCSASMTLSNFSLKATETKIF